VPATPGSASPSGPKGPTRTGYRAFDVGW
jgi:hypothetical protein